MDGVHDQSYYLHIAMQVKISVVTVAIVATPQNTRLHNTVKENICGHCGHPAKIQ
jgi:hypothetical protein